MPPKALVLIVDDEADFREVAARLLERAGYATAAAEDGESALRLFAARAPDLVLLDGHLPGLDGFEVCRRLRRDPRGKKVPILLCTVRSSLGGLSEGLAAGATGYVLKPFEPDELVAQVARALDAEPPAA